jgi:hypothetical protein
MAEDTYDKEADDGKKVVCVHMMGAGGRE